MRLLFLLLCSGSFLISSAQNENSSNITGLAKSYKIVIEKRIWDGKGIGANSDMIRNLKSTGTTYQKDVLRVFPELEGKQVISGRKAADYIVVIRQYSPELHTVDFVEVDQYSITSRYAFNITYAQKIEVCIYDNEGKLLKSQFVNKNNDEYQESFSKVLANPTYAINVNETPQGFSQMIREYPDRYLKLNDRIKEALAAYAGEAQASVQ